MQQIWLMSLMIALCICGLTTAARGQEQGEFERLRTEMLARQRRVILNNDGGDATVKAKAPTPEGMLAARTIGLEDTHVDSIFYCTNRGTFSRHSHRSEVSEPFMHIDGRYSRNIVPALAQQGTDPLQVMVDWCRENDVEIFWSERMNDRHDAGNPVLLSDWKREHPECLMGTQEDPPPYGAWSQVDYAQQAVRDQMFAIIEDVCESYDVDGIEMDFFRHPCFFRTVAWGEHATDEQRATMTGFVQRVRGMTERVGREREKPILLAIRIPDSVPLCHAMGLDIEAWLSEGLVDLVTGSGYFRMNPWSYLAELGRRHGVKVYACLSDSRVNADRSVHDRRGQESYRGRADRAWQAGVDGIYLFNMFNPHQQFLSEIGDPEVLAGLDRTYFATVRGAKRRSYGQPDYWIADGSKWRNVPILSPEDPLAIPPGEAREVALELGQDPWATADAPVEARLHVMSAVGPVSVGMNGEVLGEATEEATWSDFELSEGALRPGVNTVQFEAVGGDDAPGTVEWQAEDLPASPWTHQRLQEGATIAEIRDGAMLIADRGEEAGDYVYFSYPWIAEPERPAEVEAEVRVIDGWNNIMVRNGERSERVMLYPDYIGTYYTRLRYEVDTTDDFHSYRVVIEGDDILVFMDGELCIDGRGKFTEPANGRNDTAFGASNSPSTGEALWRSVRVTSPGLSGAQVYDLAVTVNVQEEQQ